MPGPFKVSTPASKNTNETRAVVAPAAGKAVVHSRDTGDPLPTKEVPDHPPAIVWPPAGGPDDRKPFKTKK